MIRFNNYLAIIILALMPMMAVAQVNDLPRSTPEAEGIESSAISRMFDTLMAIPNTEIHHVMIVRHGKVVAELHPAPYKAEYQHTLYSCSKTFVSMAIGIAINENKLRLTDRVASFFPEYLPDSISANLANMTVRNLLTMTSGIVTDWEMRNHEINWIKSYLSKPVSVPGNDYRYDSMCSFMLSAILQRVTGVTTLDYLKENLFNPMNITKVDWQESPDGISTGGWGLRLQSESLAKFGILMLNKGLWSNRQLVPAQWIADASTKQVDSSYGAINPTPTDGNQGYGYQIRCCKYPGAFRADGAYGQFVVMIPDKDIVVVINSNCIGYTDNELNAIWNDLMPGVKNVSLRVSKDYDKLVKQSADARLAIPMGKKSSPLAKSIIGKVIKLQKNNHNIENLMIENMDGYYTLNIKPIDANAYAIPFKYNDWSCDSSIIQPPYSVDAMARFKGIITPYVVAGTYSWTSANTLLFLAHYVNWISSRSFKISFKGDIVSVEISENFSLDSNEKINGILIK